MLKRGEDEGVGVEGNDLRFQRMMMAHGMEDSGVFRYRTLWSHSHTIEIKEDGIYQMFSTFCFFLFELKIYYFYIFFLLHHHISVSQKLFLLYFIRCVPYSTNCPLIAVSQCIERLFYFSFHQSFFPYSSDDQKKPIKMKKKKKKSLPEIRKGGFSSFDFTPLPPFLLFQKKERKKKEKNCDGPKSPDGFSSSSSPDPAHQKRKEKKNFFLALGPHFPP
jgi:hypothetical protein